VLTQPGGQLVDQDLLVVAGQVGQRSHHTRELAIVAVAGSDEFERALVELLAVGVVEQNVAGSLVLLTNHAIAIDAQEAHGTGPHVGKGIGNRPRGARLRRGQPEQQSSKAEREQGSPGWQGSHHDVPPSSAARLDSTTMVRSEWEPPPTAKRARKPNPTYHTNWIPWRAIA